MKRIAFLLLLGIVAAFAACSNDGGGQLKDNQAPTVWLSAGPPEGSTGKYLVQMYWGGWDPDGEISGYEYIIADNATGVFNPADTLGMPWRPVAGNDSVFTFSADQVVDSLETQEDRNTRALFTRSHSFFVRSIDEEGLRSRMPASRSFTAETISPEVKIQVPKQTQQNPAIVPPITTFKWTAKDFVSDLSLSQDPESVQYALVNTANPAIPGGGVNRYEQAAAYLASPAGQKEFLPWVYYRAPEDSGKFWTTPPVDLGTYVFAIRAKDEAGAITPVLREDENWRRVKVNARNSGPLMTLTNEYLGAIRTVSCASPVTILDSPAGVPLAFRVSADASSYGGEEAGYRYGWDIPDINDPEQWEIDLTPFLPAQAPNLPNAAIPPRTFFFGTHTLTVEVVDNSGYCSRLEVKVNIVQFSFERNVLVVDDFALDDAYDGWGDGTSPSDAQHDAFWMDMVSEVVGFDPELDIYDTRIGEIPLGKLAQYKSIIWSVASDVSNPAPPAQLYLYISHRQKNPPPGAGAGGGKVKPNILALAMAAGGHIMVAGQHPIQLNVNRALDGRSGMHYPIIWQYELEPEGAELVSTQSSPPEDLDNPVGDLSFAYRDLCLETMDYAYNDGTRIRKRRGNNATTYCSVEFIRDVGPQGGKNDTMRSALVIDSNFPALSIRPEAGGPGKLYAPEVRGLDVEVYNPAYFRRNSGKPGACTNYVPANVRPCFQPIYGLNCLDTAEPTYQQPVAFWTSVYADRVAADVPGSVGARSVVFGFPPVYMDPVQVQLAMDVILFDEWQLPRGSNLAVARAIEERLGKSRD